MSSGKGYYSLIQYCPDLERLEVANVGVLVFCPDRRFLKAMTTCSNSRIMTFFGEEGHDWARIDSFKKGLEQRLQIEGVDIQTLEDLQRFIALRGNLLQITPPRPMKVVDPEQDLKNLFFEITGETPENCSAKSIGAMAEKRTAPLSVRFRKYVVLKNGKCLDFASFVSAGKKGARPRFFVS